MTKFNFNISQFITFDSTDFSRFKLIKNFNFIAIEQD